MKKPKSQNRFFFIATLVLLVFGLLIVVFRPIVNNIKANIATKLIADSARESEPKKQLSLLEQAHIIDNKNIEATNKLVKFWLDRGEVNRAIQVYLSSSDPDYISSGQLALVNHDYNKALNYFEKATLKHETSESLAGESKTLFNLGRITDGCKTAVRASKLSLSNTAAKSTLQVCIVLDPSNQEAGSLVANPALQGERDIAYFLLDNNIYKLGEERLLAVKNKSANDLLTLCKLSASRGALDEAISRCSDGIKIDNSNIGLNAMMIDLYTLTGNSPKTADYSTKFNQLQFTKYQ